MVLAYSKASPNHSNTMLMIVSLDSTHPQSGWTTLSLDRLGLATAATFEVEDLLTRDRYEWHGRRNFFRLDPSYRQAHLLKIVRR
jgi:starch synthase (maltosyl-transferring)